MRTHEYKTPQQEAEEAKKAAEHEKDLLCDIIQDVDMVFATTPREDLPDITADNLRSMRDNAEREFFRKDFKWLLKEVTARYNEEVAKNYHRGELDFIPKDQTEEEVLRIVLLDYARRNYPDILS